MKKIITQCSSESDVLLEPFAGTGSFCAAAKYLGRNFIGFDQNKEYVKLATKRLEDIKKVDEKVLEPLDKDIPKKKIPFGNLVHEGYLEPGEILYNIKDTHRATIQSDGSIRIDDDRGSIHQIAALVNKTSSFNGWDYWHYKNKDQKLESIDVLRNKLRD